MSLGGEVSNASAYLAEIAPPERRGRYSSFFYISTGSAVLIASLLGALLASNLSDDQLASWGWRVPFFIGGLLGLVGLWLRRDMAETEQFEENKAKAKAIKNPLMMTLREHPRAVAQLIGLHAALHAVLLHVLLGADPVRGQAAEASTTAWCSGRCRSRPRCSWCCSTPSAGPPTASAASRRCSSGPALIARRDRADVEADRARRRASARVLLVFCFGLGLYAIFSSIAPAIMSELFPTELRGLGIGAWYNLTVAVFGGTAPLVIQWLGRRRAQQLVLLVRRGRRRHRVPRDPDAARRPRGRC